MIKITEKMELMGNAMISVIYLSNLEDIDAYSDDEAEVLDKMALEKIKVKK